MSTNWVVGKKRCREQMDQNLKSNKVGFLLLMSKGEGNLLWEDEELKKKNVVDF